MRDFCLLGDICIVTAFWLGEQVARHKCMCGVCMEDKSRLACVLLSGVVG